MTDNDEITRLRQAFAAPAEASWKPAGCPEPDRIWEAVRGELPPDEVRDIVEHVAACSSCAEDWRIAMTFEEETRRAEQPGDDARGLRPAASRFRPWMAAAAAALVLTVVGIQLRPVKPPVYRSGEGAAVVTLDKASASRESFVLAWKPVEDAESYELLVTTTDLRTIADPKGLTATQYPIPESALADLSSGTPLHWRVTVVFPDGSRRQSATATTTLE